MTATTTTPTTTTIDTHHAGAALTAARGARRGAASVFAAIGARWSDFVDGGQLGPSADTMTSRHTGSRI